MMNKGSNIETSILSLSYAFTVEVLHVTDTQFFRVTKI